MSSESNGRKPDSVEPGPTSGTGSRLSARAPATWGPVRDALSSLHNLGALLKSTSVRYKVIRDLLPELRSSAAVLGEVFERAAGSSDEATANLGAHGRRSVDALVQLLDATHLAEEERDNLAVRAKERADNLDAAAEMLALLERAAEPVATDVSLQLIVHETGRLWGGGHRREVTVHLDDGAAPVTVVADPYVVGPLLSLLVGLVSAAGAAVVALRVSDAGAHAVIEMMPATAEDLRLRAVSVRVLPSLPDAEAIARRVAAQIGGTLELKGTSALLRLPKSPG